MLLEIAGTRNAQVWVLLTAAQQLSAVQAARQRTEYAVSQLLAQRAGTRNSIKKLLDAEKATLGSLTAQQQAVQAGSLGGTDGTTQATYTGPTSTQAGKAVAFTYAQLGKPYTFSGGPGGQITLNPGICPAQKADGNNSVIYRYPVLVLTYHRRGKRERGERPHPEERKPLPGTGNRGVAG